MVLQHLVEIHFGLEGCIKKLTPKEYAAIIARDQPGASTNKAKAARMRSFHYPEDMQIEGSSTADRYLNIFAAIVSKRAVFVILDFARLVRLNFISRGTMWMQSELVPGTEVGYPVFYVPIAINQLISHRGVGYRSLEAVRKWPGLES